MSEGQPYTFPWDFGDGWKLPATRAISTVRLALEQGLGGPAAIDWIRSRGIPAAVVPAGTASPASAVVWYAKGPDLDGKFQYVSADGPYPEGWEIRWQPNTNFRSWEFHPFAGPVDVPVPPAPPAPPSGPPDDPSVPGWFLAFMVDVHKIVGELDELNQNVLKISNELHSQSANGVKVRW